MPLNIVVIFVDDELHKCHSGAGKDFAGECVNLYVAGAGEPDIDGQLFFIQYVCQRCGFYKTDEAGGRQ